MLGPCGRGVSGVVCRIVNDDRRGVSGKRPRDLLSGLMTRMLHRTTAGIRSGPTSVKLIGVKKLHGVLPTKSVAIKAMCRVLPFRGSLYMVGVGKARLGTLLADVTSLGKRKIDNVQVRVAGSKGLLGTAINNRPVSSGGLCAITAVSCLTSNGKDVRTFLRTSSHIYPRKAALHKLFLSCIERRATTKGGVASTLSNEVAIGWGHCELWGSGVRWVVVFPVGGGRAFFSGRGALLAFFFVLFVSFSTFKRRSGGLVLLRADSIRDHLRPVGRRNSQGCSGNKFMHHTAFIGRFHGRRPSVLLFSYKSVSRKAPCCGVFRNRIRIGVVGRVGCSTVAVNGRRFSFSLSGVTHLFQVTSFPIIYTGCSMDTAILGSLIGPCIIFRESNIGVKILKLNYRLRNVMRTGGYMKIICGSPIAMTGRITTILGRGRKYSMIIYLSRLNIRCSRGRLVPGAHGVSIILKNRSRAFVGNPGALLGVSNGGISLVRANGDNVCMKRVSLALRGGGWRSIMGVYDKFLGCHL